MASIDLVAARPRVARPALTERIRGALDRGALMLVAEAGFGKTTALEQALGESSRVGWLACRAADQDPRRLLMRMIGVLGEVAPGAVDVLAERIATQPQFEPAGVARDLAGELERLVVDRVVIVIDDAEELAAAPGALDVLGGLLEGCGSSYGVALASRRPLPLKLAKLRAAGRLEELGSGELAFSAAECAEVMRLRAHGSPTEREVDEVMAATEGWPLGVALSFARAGSARPATRDRLFEFLDEELLAGLPADLRDLVLASSIVDELDAELLSALGLGGDFPARVRAAGIQLRGTGEGGQGLTYQPLVREFLLSKLHSLWPPERRQELHTRAAAALSAAGRDFEAVDHWLAAGRFDDAVASLGRLRPGLAATASEAVDRWLAALPAEARAAPACRLLEGQLAWSRGRHEEAVRLLEVAIEGAAAAGDASLEWSARFALCEPLGMTGRFEQMAELADGFDSSGRDAGLPALATGFYGAIAHGCLGRTAQMSDTVARLLADPAGGEIFRALRAAWEQFALVPAGRFDELSRGLDEGLAVYERADPFGRLPQQLLVSALALMDQGLDNEALDRWHRTERAAEQAHMGYLAALARAERARIHVHAGRMAEAEAELARAGAQPGGWEAYAWQIVEAALAAGRGRVSEALAHAEKTLAVIAPATVLERERIALDVVPILFEAGAPARARALVDGMLDLLDAHYPHAAGRYLRSLLLGLRAWMLHGTEPGPAATRELAHAWTEAEANTADFVRRLGTRLRPLLWEALEHGTIAPDELVRAHELAFPGGELLLEYTRHPLPGVRRAAAASLAASGRPDAVVRLTELVSDADADVASAAEAIRARVSADPPALGFRLLGGFAVCRGSWQPDEGAWERRIAQRLVRFLLIHREAPVHEDELVEAFWPEKATAAARRSLQVALSCARAVLDTPGAHSVIENAERTYVLRLRERDTVDVDEFERAVAAALSDDTAARLDLLMRAERLWGGEPLPEERYSDWAIPWRETLLDRYGAVLGLLVDSHLARGDHPAAVETARRLVALDPLGEGGHRSLMVAYARSGRRAHALRQYLECRRRLVDELGIEPAAETNELQRRILTGDSV